MKDSIIQFRFFKYIYNKYDSVIRFTFTKVPLIRDLTRKIMFWMIYSSDFKHIDNTFTELKKTLDQYGITFKDKKILEIGPGNSIALALNSLCNGANKYIMVDKYRRILKTEKQAKYLFKQIKYFENKYNCNLAKLINKDTMEFNDHFLAYIPDSAEDLRNITSNSIDIVLSMNVLEHIRDVDNSFREMKRVLKNGGVMYHVVDMRDHYNFNKPFIFLKYSDFVWNNFLTKEGYSYTNRLRIDDFESLLLKHNFKILEINKDNYEFDLPEQIILNNKFRHKNLDNLKVVGAKMLVVR